MPGFTGVLHTWGRLLQYHPHIHFIVPGGGLTKDRAKWLPARNSFYLPVRALSKIYRAKFKAEMEAHGLADKADPAAWELEWNVNCQAVGDSEASLKYLAPYVFRVAISDSRIVAVNGRQVSFSYRKKGSNRPRKTTLDVLEFMRRFLQHVLPAGFMKVRHYGFMSANCAVSISRLRIMVLASIEGVVADLSGMTSRAAPPEKPKPRCKTCGGALLYLYGLFPGGHCRGST